MNTMHNTVERNDQNACPGLVVRRRFTTKNSHRIACFINDAVKEIVAVSMTQWSRRRIEMAAQKENINGSKKQSIIVSLLNLRPFSFPGKHMRHPRSSWIDLQRYPLWSSMLTEETLKVKALTNHQCWIWLIRWHRRRQCDRWIGGSVTLLCSVVLFEFFLLYVPSNLRITWLVHAIHSAGLVFKKMSTFTPKIFCTISFDHAMLFRVQYYLKVLKRKFAFHILSIGVVALVRGAPPTFDVSFVSLVSISLSWVVRAIICWC